ncbi:alpha-L-arabinofuranosidase B [Streptomyces sp. NPDC058369]|uniref:alpha-L-arabinofuranosidase B n=1 Tax=unclassified Streptomyces TaxID=2593676 RepID=UPI002254A0E5|nr:alpha-L-arabinofuranosidase B [Streptomyces sp. NBC_01789]MCX4451140.1 alpha-L-arabinofuranosidase B [Streptomyces sp. NBC_01789]
MTVQTWLRRARRSLLATGTTAVLTVALLVGTEATSQAATQGPCDLYASGGTPCVAAHSTTRALYGAYNGALYQVRRASDNATKDIGLLSAGGYADAGAQDAFCAGTTCVITVIYDQSGRGNSLTQAPGGGAAPGPDNLAPATAAPVTVAGHRAYGVYVAAGTGYRNNRTNGVATGDQPEGMYAVLDGTHFGGGCCFDYGNAETNNLDTGNGHMEAIYFGDSTIWGKGTGSGPWVMADLENGLFSGPNAGYNANDPSVSHRFLTAIVKGAPNLWAIKAGNAQSGGLSTYYSGARPNVQGYNPMHKEGAIILGIGGDNSKSSSGTFYEGVMTSGYPTDATENAVQANITAADYQAPALTSTALTPGARVSLKATTTCCNADYLRHQADGTVAISPITAASSGGDKNDATWIVRAGLANSACLSFESAGAPGQYLRHAGFQLRTAASDATALFNRDATFCLQAGHSGQGYSFQSANYPNRFIRHYSYTGYLAGDGVGGNTWDSDALWSEDTSWLTAQPWS